MPKIVKKITHKLGYQGHFCECGRDACTCQGCGSRLCGSLVVSTAKGNKCKSCAKVEETTPTPVVPVNPIRELPTEPSKSALAGLVKSLPSMPPHVVVVARAGTGKTTTLVEGLKALKGMPTSITPSAQQRAVWDQIVKTGASARSVCFAAFNKTIAEELKKRVPAGCEASTLHSMGFSACRRKFGKQLRVDEHRVDGIVEALLGMSKKQIRDDQPLLLPRVKQLVSLCKVNLLSGTSDELEALCGRYDVDFGDRYERDELMLEKMDELKYQVFGLVRLVLDMCKNVAADNAIDFDDMIWVPVVNDLPCWRHDLLLVDEAQDMNRCQQALAKKCGNRLILVGDDHQAIYGFAGADSESIARMTAELKATPRGCVVLPLTETRRCGRKIVEVANQYVSDFTAHESNPEGLVDRREYPTAAKGLAPQDESKTYLPLVKVKDMIVCRANAPLVSQCIKLLKRGIRAYVVGKADVAQSIVSLIVKMDCQTVTGLTAKIEEWAANEVAKENAKKEPRESKIDRINDRRDCVLAFCEDMPSVQAVLDRINKIFTEQADAVKLSSIHKAKGLEAKRVFFLAPGGFRPKHPRMQEWEWQQELNCRYVGITRAIEELYYVF